MSRPHFIPTVSGDGMTWERHLQPPTTRRAASDLRDETTNPLDGGHLKMKPSKPAKRRARVTHHYAAVVTDGDGTLSNRDTLARQTIAALERLRKHGRILILATGESREEVDEFPHVGLFDLV